MARTYTIPPMSYLKFFQIFHSADSLQLLHRPQSLPGNFAAQGHHVPHISVSRQHLDNLAHSQLYVVFFWSVHDHCFSFTANVCVCIRLNSASIMDGVLQASLHNEALGPWCLK